MRVTKYWTVMILGVLALVIAFGGGWAAERHLGVVVNGQKLDIPVRVMDGQVVAPIRPIAELLGAEVHWWPSAGGVRIDNWRTVPQPSWPGQQVAPGEYQVWYDLTPASVGMSAEEAVAIAREQAGMAFRVNHAILTRVDRESLYTGGSTGPGPMNRPIWLVFFDVPPDSYMLPTGPPPPTYRNYWKPKPVQPVDQFVRIDAQTAEVDGVRNWDCGALSPGPYGDVLQRVFDSIPSDEYETFWNFPRFVGTFFPARVSTNEPQERYSTDISLDADKCWVRLSHEASGEVTIWTFVVSKNGTIERERVVKKTH